MRLRLLFRLLLSLLLLLGISGVADAKLAPATTTYDHLGRLTSLTDQVGAQTQFTHDDRGLVLEREDPLGRSTTSTYDDRGQLIQQTDRNGDTQTASYTPTGKLDQLTYPDHTVQFDYDSRDQLVQMVDPLGTTTNRYDALGRLTGHTDPNGFSVDYEYDALGNLTRLTYPDGNSVSYEYDALDRVSRITIDWLGVDAVPSYDAAGRLTRLDHFNGSASDYRYDAADRLTGLTHQIDGQPTDYAFTLDANGNRTRAVIQNELLLPGGLINDHQSHQYNTPRNRLTGATIDGQGVSFSYDHEGQLTTKGATDYAFDSAHRLTDYGSNHFAYDGAGNRLSATRDGVTTQYIYDAVGNLLAEANASGEIQRYYIHGLGLMALVEAPTDALYVYHFDATGHTLALSDADQQIVNRYAYSPYGRLMAAQVAVAQPFTYVGQAGVMTEPDGLYYMRARYYDAEVGRFISEDPIGFAGGLNLYAYVGGNPIRLIDPSGLGAEGGGFGAAVLDFGLGFIPGYDLYQAINDPNATGFDIFLGATSLVPGGGKAVNILGKVGKAAVKKGKEFRGGKKRDRDQWGKYSSEKDFQRWWHRKGKEEYGGQDLEPEMLDDVYLDWVNQGRPPTEGKVMKRDLSVTELMYVVEHGEWEEALAAAEKIVAENGAVAFYELVPLLRSDRRITKNVAALAIRELRDNRAVEALFAAIRDTRNADDRSTLVYALETLDCREHFLDVVDLVFSDKADVRLAATNILMEQGFLVDDEDVAIAKSRVECLKPNSGDALWLEAVEARISDFS